MGTHPIFESDFDCLTDNRIHTTMGHLEAELTNDMVKLFRRPSIAPEEVRRSSKANIEAQMSTLAPSKSEEKVGSSEGAGRQAKLDDSEDLEKFLFYRPMQSRAYVLKSVAFQQRKDLRMATMSIKMAQELGLAPAEEKTLQLRLASIEFKQAEKLKQQGEPLKAIERYQLASEIIDNYEDALVIIIKLRFELGHTEQAMRLLDRQIELEPDRLELRVWRTR